MKKFTSLTIPILVSMISASCTLFPQETPMKTITIPENAKTATFAGGCFWCLDPAFDNEPGVFQSIVGYAGGYIENPNYEQVLGKQTGHRESIQVTYDPTKVSYERLVEVFFHQIDPTDDGGQFADR